MTEPSVPPVSPESHHRDALAAGARLDEFEIQKLLGVGGFGMVYQAFDHTLHRQVAIKEYMPTLLAGRGSSKSIHVRASDQEGPYRTGLSSFISEARLLARFDHPSLVKVFRFWEANNTAYMVMPLYKGLTLKQARTQAATPPPEALLRSILSAALGALGELHAHGVLHRDISPDNIFLQDVGPPVLLDLGAARHAIQGHERQFTAVLKVHYAPIEQYAEGPSPLPQGAWSDLYALAAVIYACVCNHAPVPSTQRAMHDTLVPFSEVAKTVAREFGVHYSASLIGAVEAAMALRPQDRPQSVEAFVQRLEMQNVEPLRSDFDFRAAWGSAWAAHKTASTAMPDWDRTVVVGPSSMAEASSALWRSEGEASVYADEKTQIFQPDISGGQAEKTLPVDWLLEAGKAPAPERKVSDDQRTPTQGSNRIQQTVQTSGKGKWFVGGLLLCGVIAAGMWLGLSSNPVKPDPALHIPLSTFNDESIITEMADDSKEVSGDPVPLSAEQGSDTSAVQPQAESAAPAFVQRGDSRGVSRQLPQVTVRTPTPSVSTSEPVEQSVAPVTSVAASSTSAQGASSTTGLCSDTNFFTRSMCLRKECKAPSNAALPVCREFNERMAPLETSPN